MENGAQRATVRDTRRRLRGGGRSAFDCVPVRGLVSGSDSLEGRRLREKKEKRKRKRDRRMMKVSRRGGEEIDDLRLVPLLRLPSFFASFLSFCSSPRAVRLCRERLSRKLSFGILPDLERCQ
jgi:hypothetical protein